MISSENLSSKGKSSNLAKEKKERKQDIKRKQKLEKEQQKRLKKLNKKLSKQKKASPGAASVAFEEPKPAPADEAITEKETAAEENVVSANEPKNAASGAGAARDEVDNNGNYDVLPLIKFQSAAEPHAGIQFNFTDDDKDDHAVLAVDVHAFSRTSSGSIPFIDQSPRRHIAPPPTEAVAIEPENRGDERPTSASEPKHSPPVLYQSLKQSVDHHFEAVDRLEHKLCQVCHEFIVVAEAIKCLTCGLVCHQSCAAQQVCP